SNVFVFLLGDHFSLAVMENIYMFGHALKILLFVSLTITTFIYKRHLDVVVCPHQGRTC
ncbi:hypothetical protein ACJX0J_018906, partial [Zea mays]